MHLGCYLKRKRTRETEGWKLAEFLRKLTDEEKLEWTQKIEGGKGVREGRVYTAKIGNSEFVLTHNSTWGPSLSLRANFTNVNLCSCHLFGLYLSVAVSVQAEEDREKKRHDDEIGASIKEIRERVEKAVSGEESEK